MAAVRRRETNHRRTFGAVKAAVTLVGQDFAAENPNVPLAPPRTRIRQPRRASTTLSPRADLARSLRPPRAWTRGCIGHQHVRLPPHADTMRQPLRGLEDLTLTPVARRERRASVALRLNTAAFGGPQQPTPSFFVRERRFERLAEEFRECGEVIHGLSVTLF